MKIRAALPADAAALSAIATRTFALACPADTPAAELQAYIDDHLGVASFAAALGDARRAVRVLEDDGQAIGFSLLDQAPAPVGIDDADAAVELTRCYVLPAHHGSGAAQRLLAATLADVAGPVRLMVNDQNARAIRFYERNGFVAVGATTFQCGEDVHRDLVMLRRG